MNTDRVSYWQAGLDYLCSKDQRLVPIIENYRSEELSTSACAYTTLSNAIVGQQISVKAAAAIWSRFVGACGCEDDVARLDGTKVMKAGLETLRALGLSYKKVAYAQGIATEFVEGLFKDYDFASKTDEEIKAALVRLPGIGPWTAEMFLIFHLARPNVLPILDIGLLKSFAQVYECEHLDRRQITQKLVEHSQKVWAPYSTIAVWYLWRHLDPGPVRY